MLAASQADGKPGAVAVPHSGQEIAPPLGGHVFQVPEFSKRLISAFDVPLKYRFCGRTVYAVGNMGYFDFFEAQ